MVFAGVGMVALPLDLFREFIGRPRATITHSEYIKRARVLGMRAKNIKVRGFCAVTDNDRWWRNEVAGMAPPLSCLSLRREAIDVHAHELGCLIRCQTC